MLIVPFLALGVPLLIKAGFLAYTKVAKTFSQALGISLLLTLAAAVIAGSIVAVAITVQTDASSEFPAFIVVIATLVPFVTDTILLRRRPGVTLEKALMISVGSNMLSSFIAVPIIAFSMIVGFFALLGTAQ